MTPDRHEQQTATQCALGLRLGDMADRVISEQSARIAHLEMVNAVLAAAIRGLLEHLETSDAALSATIFMHRCEDGNSCPGCIQRRAILQARANARAVLALNRQGT